MRILLVAFLTLSVSGCASWGKNNKAKAELYMRMGLSQIESGNYPYALRDLLKAEELDPDNALIQNNLGLIYFYRKRFDLAEQHIERAIKLESTYTEARNNLSRVYIEVGKYKEAEAVLAEVLNDLTFPNPEKAYINLGLAKFNQKDYSSARKAFASAIESAPDDCIANSYLGRSRFEAEEYPQAAEILDKAVGFCQKNAFDEPHYYSALAYYRMGEKTKSMARFEEVIKYYPSGKYREKAKGMLSLIRKGH